MAERKTDGKISLRTYNDEYALFSEVCAEKHDKKPHELLRELICAVGEGRVKITPTEEQRSTFKQHAELYNVN